MKPVKIQAVSFDIGHTLVKYNNPLNWKRLYKPALEKVLNECGFEVSDQSVKTASAVLTKYNTRENPRENEIGSEIIFKEILDAWGQPYDNLNLARSTFYGFFQADAVCYDDVVGTLRSLKSAGIKIGALTDVAYGMDNSFSLQDIAEIRQYFDLVLTSVDVGFRKPNEAGFRLLLRGFDIAPAQMIYVGDEKKDIVGANAAGLVSTLICRNSNPPDWGQDHTIQSLLEIPGLIEF